MECAKRNTCKDKVVFTCNSCEAEGKVVSALATFENDEYQLTDAPSLDDHSCWATGHKPAIKKASALMYQMVREDPTRSVPKIWEEVRNKFAEGMDKSTKISFLQEFSKFRNMAANLYKTRREVIPADIKEMRELDSFSILKLKIFRKYLYGFFP